MPIVSFLNVYYFALSYSTAFFRAFITPESLVYIFLAADTAVDIFRALLVTCNVGFVPEYAYQYDINILLTYL